LQLITGAGIENVRIRGMQAGDEPRLENRGTDDRPRYHVLGVLSSRGELQVPGGRFGLADRRELADYFERLAADGAEGVTAELGRFGLTERQFGEVHGDLAHLIGGQTKGRRVHEIIRDVQSKFQYQIEVAPAARNLLQTETAMDEVGKLTAGTGLAILLRPYGLALQPGKPRGGDVVHRIVSATTADEEEVWPIGWKPPAGPRQAAPQFFEYTNVQIEGYTLREALTAIEPRLDVPFLFDHQVLESRGIEPDKLQVKLARTNTFYSRILGLSLSQARLRGELRVDEAGTVFYWISR
jgi:hypothetical protein